nr:MAG TPA: hypothetical protein [Bacteriophage sp.]
MFDTLFDRNPLNPTFPPCLCRLFPEGHFQRRNSR